MFFKNLFSQPLNVGERNPAPDAVIEIDEVTPEIQNYIDRGLGALVDKAPAKTPPPPPPPPADAEDQSDKKDGNKAGGK